jgi:hypothetical protein
MASSSCMSLAGGRSKVSVATKLQLNFADDSRRTESIVKPLSCALPPAGRLFGIDTGGAQP